MVEQTYDDRVRALENELGIFTGDAEAMVDERTGSLLRRQSLTHHTPPPARRNHERSHAYAQR